MAKLISSDALSKVLTCCPDGPEGAYGFGVGESAEIDVFEVGFLACDEAWRKGMDVYFGFVETPDHSEDLYSFIVASSEQDACDQVRSWSTYKAGLESLYEAEDARSGAVVQAAGPAQVLNVAPTGRSFADALDEMLESAKT